MKIKTILIIALIVIILLILIVKILKWPLIIGGLALLIYLGYSQFMKKGKS